MLKWIEATGRSEDAAVQNALAQLGLDRDSVSVKCWSGPSPDFWALAAPPPK